MKRTVLIIIIFISIFVNLYSEEIYSLGFKSPIMSLVTYGGYYSEYNYYNDSYYVEGGYSILPGFLSFSPLGLLFTIDYNNFFALENSFDLGFYWGEMWEFRVISSVKFMHKINNIASMYATLGGGLAFSFIESYDSTLVDIPSGDYELLEKKRIYYMLNAVLTPSVGMEFAVKKINFLGFRCQYDYNIQIFANTTTINNFTLYFTYRRII